ncbi:MAG: hypothetical protein ACRDRT_01680, partial [Pseudonocardiaceae bacterium]
MASSQNLRDLVVELTARGDKFEAVLKSVEGRLGSFEKSVKDSTAKVEGAFASITGVAGKVQAGIAAIGAVAALGGLTSLTVGAL